MTIGKKKLLGKIDNLNYEVVGQQESVWCDTLRKCLKMNGGIECRSGCWQWG